MSQQMFGQEDTMKNIKTALLTVLAGTLIGIQG
jgi:hypothetical protein